MKPNKQQATPGRESKTSSNERNDQNGTATKVTAEDYHDNIDHCQEELQQVGLLASDLAQTKRESSTITTRLSALVPNILVKSHQQISFDCNKEPEEPQKASTLRKMLRGRENNNLAHSGDPVDVESNHKKASKCSLSTICCILFILMAISIAAVIVVFVCYSPQVLDSGDRCSDGLKRSHNYNLFSTKTTYTAAFYQLNRSPSVSSPSHEDHPDQQLDRNKVQLPNIFSSKRSLKELHDELAAKNCSLRRFQFFGRHAARTPDSDEIEKSRERLERIIKLIAQSRRQAELEALQSLGEQSAPQRLSTDQPSIQSPNVSEVVCHDPLSQLTSWDNWTHVEEGNQITELGYQESEAIAKRFKNIFPIFFDNNQAEINVHTTLELRTAQTALSFLRQIDNLKNINCPLTSFPLTTNRNPSNAKDIQGNDCFRRFLTLHHDPALSFHKDCKQFAKTYLSIGSHVLNSSSLEPIAESLTKKLQLSIALTPEDVKVIYDTCRYDTAQFGRLSVWCHLFEEKELKFLEYRKDVEDYHGDAYGLPYQYESACKVSRKVIKSFTEYASREHNATHQADFHFTHSTAIQRLIAASIDLSQDPAYLVSNELKYFSTGSVPDTRQWRTSLFSPFSANIAFNLYDCSTSTDLKGEGKSQQIDLDNLKVVVSLNEQPIKLKGCKDQICDFSSFVQNKRLFRHITDEECDLETICSQQIQL